MCNEKPKGLEQVQAEIHKLNKSVNGLVYGSLLSVYSKPAHLKNKKGWDLHYARDCDTGLCYTVTWGTNFYWIY